MVIKICSRQVSNSDNQANMRFVKFVSLCLDQTPGACVVPCIREFLVQSALLGWLGG